MIATVIKNVQNVIMTFAQIVNANTANNKYSTS